MSALKIVAGQEAEGLPQYEISASERLDSHYFLQWNMKRWRGSEFRKTCDPDVGWYGFQLFNIAQDGTPIGTLPCDDKQLAFDLNLPLERWQALCKRDVTPLHGWHKVLCDNGEVRLGHKVVTEVALEALKSKRSNAAAAHQRKMNKRLADLRGMVERLGAKHLLRSPDFIERFNEWLEQHRAGLQRREATIKEALDHFMSEVSR
ncbi:MAG: hypothetical protein KJ731_01800 [Alphaproteobacteria bacterium]|uniref:Uncharacterized protein n=1 Tax=viral metagenome TaxID=1070528 RepID=A0A6M3KBE7_9ZZZZ|nr:hypothetical protein [Alphaproteobacteria bacterium]MBU1280276.1 hypothetical protein [Alphaproteobacteria bacterium]MBU1573015.1 hypothetical protein [Alphaproteobacteria bacterium]MBU1827202.1 hypothetical protein [Alphaproteobacteria bacterium]MBU2079974.1 hypothetical protein [Alphaproteobacteria bacterium]